MSSLVNMSWRWNETYGWIEKTLGKKLLWQPIKIGFRFGRELYTIVFDDHTEGDYFIDYDKMEIEKY